MSSTTTPPGGQDGPQRSSKADLKAAQAHYKASRPWCKKKRYMLPLALVILVVIFTSKGGGDSADKTVTAASDTTATATPSQASQPTAAPSKVRKAELAIIPFN